MEYTHTFEVHANGVSLNGELSLTPGGVPSLKTDSAEEMTITQHGKLQSLFEVINNFNSSFGEITKIEINKK